MLPNDAENVRYGGMMSLFKNLFGKGDPVAELERLHARREWAALLAAAKRLDRTALAGEVRAQVAGWEAEAGDRLAQLNLDEGAGALRNGNLLKARDHLQLAVGQASTVALRERAGQLLAELDGGAPAREAAAAGCGSGCGPTCAPEQPAPGREDELGDAARLELLLATLPDDLAESYAAAGETFLKGWLAAQEGDDERALTLFEQVPAGERCPLFRAERGVVLARNDQAAAAEADLRAALGDFPELFHPFDALVTLLAVTRRHDELEALLRQTLSEGRFAGYSLHQQTHQEHPESFRQLPYRQPRYRRQS